MTYPASESVPPMNVEYFRLAPFGATSVKNASMPPAYFGWNEVAVVGKFAELVRPVK